jgi:iron complex transport system substrate-binding protein
MRFFFLIIFLFLFSCLRQIPEKDTKSKESTDFTKGFRIEEHEDYKLIKVYNPWQKADNIEFTYILSASPSNLPDSLLLFPVIKTPVKKVVTMSTTHIGIISALGESGSIAGISGKEFVRDSIVRRSVEEKKCFDVGYAPNLDFERILAIKPDVVFLYGLEASVLSVASRLNEAGIVSVLVSEYLEDHPLGKAEWIKFFAAFYGKDDEGRRIFNTVQKHYIQLCDSVKSVSHKPAILAGIPWKDTWFLPGGKSFSARFIVDAGGNYLWKDDKSKEFIALDLESVFHRAIDAEIWINTGTVESKNELISRDNRFGGIKALKLDSLYNNNARLSTGGGNDYWESGVVYPDIILHDLIEIFHPGLLAKHELYYYRKLE